MGSEGRCSWAVGGLMTRYHDTEWGVPEHNDTRLYECLVLQGAQAGLSWNTILDKRDGYRSAFSGFDPTVVAGYTSRDVHSLMRDGRIVRNRLKIESAINNAARFLEVQKEYGSFDAYIWDLVGGPTKNRFKDATEVPASTPSSHKMSSHLKRRGFTFVGPVICYAYMQAAGMVNDHTAGCFLYQK